MYQFSILFIIIQVEYLIKKNYFLFQELECLADQVYILKDYPARGFCLKLSSFPGKNLENFVTKIFFIIEWLQNNEVAHNIAITRAKSLGQDFYDDVRVYIWATKISTGIKDTSAFVPAVSESFGLLCIRSNYFKLFKNFY